MNISERLKAVAGMLKYNGVVADIGTDHGYLPIYLVLNGYCSKAVAMDINKGPLEKAKNNVTSYGVSQNIELRLSDGLQKLNSGEADSVVIAGMGGELIVKILQQGEEVLQSVKELVLSPQSEIFKVREYLCDNGYLIDAENMIKEDGKYYQIIHAIKGEGMMLKGIEYDYGKCLLADNNPVLKEFLLKEFKKHENIYHQLEKNEESLMAKERLVELSDLMEGIKEALAYYEK